MLDINGDFPKYQIPRPITNHGYQNAALTHTFSKLYQPVPSDELALNYRAM